MSMRRRGMSQPSKTKVINALQSAMSQPDPVRRVMAVDTVLDLALTELGFTGSLGDKLKKAAPRISNLQAVWEAHKMRNQVAHEHDAQLDPKQADWAVRILEKAIRDLAR